MTWNGQKGGVSSSTSFQAASTKTGENPLQITATDSRGKTASVTAAVIQSVPYELPVIHLSAVRDGYTKNVAIAGTIRIHPLTIGDVSYNDKVITVGWREEGQAQWTDITADVPLRQTDEDGVFQINHMVSDTFDLEKSCQIQVSVSDLAGHTNTRTFQIPKAAPLLTLCDDGAAGINCYPEDHHVLTVKGNTKLTGSSSVHSASGREGASGYVQIAEIGINGAYTDAPITMELCRRHTDRTCTLYIQFQSSETNDPPLKTFLFYGTDYQCYLSRTESSVWKLYVQKTDQNDHIGVLRCHVPMYELNNVLITWTNLQVENLPEGSVAAFGNEVHYGTFHNHGNISLNTSGSGYFLKDSTGYQYPGLYDNGGLWIGATQAAARHHRGATYISTGHSGSAGHPTAYVSVPNASNNGASTYGLYHSGNYTSIPTATTAKAGLMSGADKLKLDRMKAGGIVGGTLVAKPGGATSAKIVALSTMNKTFNTSFTTTSVAGRIHVLASNGDAIANPAHINGVSFNYNDNYWYAVFDRSVQGSIRINWIAICLTAIQ